MNHGKLEAIGTPTEVLTQNNLKNVFKIVSSIGTTNEEGINQKFIVPLKNIH